LEDILSIKKVAEHFNRRRSWVYDKIKSGELGCYRDGNRILGCGESHIESFGRSIEITPDTVAMSRDDFNSMINQIKGGLEMRQSGERNNSPKPVKTTQRHKGKIGNLGGVYAKGPSWYVKIEEIGMGLWGKETRASLSLNDMFLSCAIQEECQAISYSIISKYPFAICVPSTYSSTR
jgi:hypothetical protein